MNTALWIVAAVLALLFFASGAGKASRPKEKVVETVGGWAESYSPASIKVIGLVEVLAAIGLIVPPLVGIAPILAPLAATGLAVIMVGAMIVHGRRTGEGKQVGFNAVLLILAVFVAWGRFGPYAF